MLTRYVPTLLLSIMLICPTWASNPAEEPVVDDSKPFQASFALLTTPVLGVDLKRITVTSAKSANFDLASDKWDYSEDPCGEKPVSFVYGDPIKVVLKFLRKVDLNFADRDHGLMIGEDCGPHQYEWKWQEETQEVEFKLSPMTDLRKELGEPGLNPTDVVFRVDRNFGADEENPKATQIFTCTLEAKLNRFYDDLMADDN